MADAPELPEGSTEAWVWDQIAAGKTADFNARAGRSRPLDPASARGWTQSRRIAPAFIRLLLTHPHFIAATPSCGVRISGALIDEAPLDLEHVRAPHPFALEHSRILTDLKWRSLRIDGGMSVENCFVSGATSLAEAYVQRGRLVLTASRFHGEFDMRNCEVGGPLDMSGSTFESKAVLTFIKIAGFALLGVDETSGKPASFKGEVDLLGAQIGDQLLMSGSTFAKQVSLNSVRIAGPLFMHVDATLQSGAVFRGEVDLVAANIGGSLDMSGSTFEANVILNSSRIGGAAHLSKGATFKGTIDLGSAEFGSSLDMSGSIFEAPVGANGARIAGPAYLNIGARFMSTVALANASIGGSLDLSSSTFEAAVIANGASVAGPAYLNIGSSFMDIVDLTAASIGGSLDLSSSTFEQKVSLNSIRIEGSLFVRFDETRESGSLLKGEVDLVAANICGSLDLRGSTFEGTLNLESARIEGAASLSDGATFNGPVALASAGFGSLLDLSGSTFRDVVNFASSDVRGHLDLSGASFEQEIQISNAAIGGQLILDGSYVEKNVELEAVKVAGSIFLRNAASFHGRLNFAFARIDGSLFLHDARFHDQVSLSGASISGELHLGSSATTSPVWIRPDLTCNQLLSTDPLHMAQLNLRNLRAGGFQDWWKSATDNSWPRSIEIDGFSYARLGGWRQADLDGSAERGVSDIAERPSESFQAWLELDRSFTPQPYEHLASLFRAMGEPRKAADILYAGRERRRHQAWRRCNDEGQPKQREWLAAIGLQVLRMTTGYGLGIRYFRALWWVGLLTLLGTAVLVFVGGQPAGDWAKLAFVSLDELLPIITLNDTAHDQIVFGDKDCPERPMAQIIYFYVHKLVGWALGTFILAGLVGLTQRN